MASDILSDIKERLLNKNIHEVRQIARAIGVSCPTDGKKGRIIDDIIAIASLEIAPAPRSARGAPPKSSDFDEDLVNDIRECMKYHTALREGSEPVLRVEAVSDGTESVRCAGILEHGEKYFFLRVNGCLASADDVFVPDTLVHRFHLKEGDFVEGECKRRAGEGAGLTKVTYVNGVSPDSLVRRSFENLTPVYPHERINLDVVTGDTAARMAGLFAPVGKGQRAVVSAPANSGKTTLVKQIATAISRDESITLVLLLIAERPEVVTDIKRSVDGAKIFYTPFEMSKEAHEKSAELVTEFCKNSAECGDDVVLIVDGLSKLGGAAKQLLSSAICAEEGGSVTVIATVSAEGEYSSEHSQELISYSNMRLILSAEAAAERIFPAIDILKSFTANCALLQSDAERATADSLRKEFKSSGNLQKIIKLFTDTKNNTEIING